MAKTCPNCDASNQDSAISCEKCHTDLEEMDLELEAAPEQPQPKTSGSTLLSLNAEDAKAVLELDDRVPCAGCGIPLDAFVRKGNDLCDECKIRKADAAKKEKEKPKTELPPDKRKKRWFLGALLKTPASGVAGTPRRRMCWMLGTGAAAVVLVATFGLTLWLFPSLLHFGTAIERNATGETQNPQNILDRAKQAHKRGKRTLTTKEAVETVQKLLGNGAIGGKSFGSPGKKSNPQPATVLEAAAATGDVDAYLKEMERQEKRKNIQPKTALEIAAATGDVDAYIEEMGQMSSSDGTVELNAIDALIDDFTAHDSKAREKALAILGHMDAEPAGLVKKLETIQKEEPSNQQVQLALAELTVKQNPERALAIAKNCPTPDGKRVAALALSATGRTNEALAMLQEANIEDSTTQRTVSELLAKSGRCNEGLDSAINVAATAGIVGMIHLLRFVVLCEGNADRVFSLADRVIGSSTMAAHDRSAVAATAALTKLWLNDVVSAQEYCDKATALAPRSPVARVSAARCKLAKGTIPKAEDLPPPVRPSETSLVAASLRLSGKDLQRAFFGVPTWRSEPALLTAFSTLNRSKNHTAALQKAADALLAPAWDGGRDIPLSSRELLALATLAPDAHQSFAQALAYALGRTNHYAIKQDAPNTLDTERLYAAGKTGIWLEAAMQYRRGNKEEVARIVRGKRANPRCALCTFLKAWVEPIPARQKARLVKLVRNRVVGPYALQELAKQGPVSPRLINWGRQQWPLHPALARAESYRAKSSGKLMVNR